MNASGEVLSFFVSSVLPNSLNLWKERERNFKLKEVSKQDFF